VAVCERNGKRHRVKIDSLEWIKPRPEGFEWIEAYFLCGKAFERGDGISCSIE